MYHTGCYQCYTSLPDTDGTPCARERFFELLRPELADVFRASVEAITLPREPVPNLQKFKEDFPNALTITDPHWPAMACRTLATRGPTSPSHLAGSVQNAQCTGEWCKNQSVQGVQIQWLLQTPHTVPFEPSDSLSTPR